MRAGSSIFVAVLAACHPSATVENTMPVANLQAYRTVALRVQSAMYANQAAYLQQQVYGRLQMQCGFQQVQLGNVPADVLVDLNIVAMRRGGTGWIQNANTATMDTLLVLSDGQTGELLGTARIQGQSSGLVVNGMQPEREAIEVVAKSVADLLAHSGCSGPRVAKTEPPPQPAPPQPTPPQPDGSNATPQPPQPPQASDDQRKQAEALDDQGKDKLRSADFTGALTAFQQANSVAPDPRYQYNICLVYEAEQQWDNAVAACKQARTMNPDERLITKIDHRIELVKNHQ